MKKQELKESRQFKNATKEQSFTNNVPLTWCVRFDLTPLDLLTYCIVRDATQNFRMKAYTGSIKGLCAKTNVSRPTQMESLKKLVKKGFLRREWGHRSEKGWVEYTAHIFEKDKPMEEQLELFSTQNALRESKFKL